MRRDSRRRALAARRRFRGCTASTSAATNEVVASWMTRQDRELAIADNLAYVAGGHRRGGARMPGRAASGACRLLAGRGDDVPRRGRVASRPVDGVIAVGGDVPPELDAAALARVRSALSAAAHATSGIRQTIFERDVERLREAGVTRQAAGVRRRPRVVRRGGRGGVGVSARAAAMIEIRAATAADAGALAELRWEFRAGREPPSKRTTRSSTLRGVDAPRARRHGAWRAWVAVDDRVIVGQVWLHTIQKIPNPIAEREQLAYLSNLYVRPSARGGIGTRLLEAALDWAPRERRRSRRALAVGAQRHALPAPRLLPRRRRHGAESHRRSPTIARAALLGVDVAACAAGSFLDSLNE